MSEAPLKIIQISDTHLFNDPSRVLLGVPTQQSFEVVLEHLRQQQDSFDLIIHSGDLTQDASKPAYQRVAEMLTRFNVPVYCVPGNHDDPRVMAMVYPHAALTNDKHIITKNWQFILLDTHKPGAVEGFLRKSELNFLQHCLHAYPEHHAAIVYHHHPVPVGSAWLDRLGLTNADELWQIVTRYPKIKAMIFGHVHQQFEEVVEGIQCFSAPSTCIQFKRHQDHFGLEDLPQGYRKIKLYEDGRIETEVVRLDHYVGHFDMDATGY